MHIPDDDHLDTFFDMPCHVIDILPLQVPIAQGKNYDALAQYLQKPEKRRSIRARFAELRLALSAYQDIVLTEDPDGGWEEAQPAALEMRVLKLAENRTLYLYFAQADALLTFDGGDLYMTLYGAKGAFFTLVQLLSEAQGLFVRRGQD